jgi:hypothetical protein
MPNTFVATISKKDDLLYLVEDETIIIFDIERSAIECLNYAVLESIKNGYWVSGKY